MKHFIAIILSLVCLLSFTACDKNTILKQDGTQAAAGNEDSSQNITPNDVIFNSDGSWKVPVLDEGVVPSVDANTWQSLLTPDAIQNAILDNSMTILTTDGYDDMYQMFYCAGGRFGNINKGEIQTQTICVDEAGTVYIYEQNAKDADWLRSTSKESYADYVQDRYTSGAMQFFSNLASAFDSAKYIEADQTYLIENHIVNHPSMKDLVGEYKVQFADGKLFGISLHFTVEDQSGAITTIFGDIQKPELPENYKDKNNLSYSDAITSDPIVSTPSHNPNSSGGSISNQQSLHISEKMWSRIFDEKHLLQELPMDNTVAKIENGNQSFSWTFAHRTAHFIFNQNGNYEEIIMDPAQRFQRDNPNGTWLFFNRKTQTPKYEEILEKKTNPLVHLLSPLKDNYQNINHSNNGDILTLSNISFTHELLGNVVADYTLQIGGDRIQNAYGTLQASNGIWKFSFDTKIATILEFPTEYTEASSEK